MKYMKCVFLDRSDMRQSLKCLEQCVEILKQGHSMVIYPEGKLDEGLAVAEFKKG
ncbi:MAG: 1-acyl-sn-glycerol-3-phosphate acyltransferase, partial [Ruminiclostridium sp.]|nr:1-acyl-sn-glycerol-3-phosphate acyltransferase [Ruminiclostridium sp.]